MFISDLYLSFTIILCSHLISTQANRLLNDSTITNLLSSGNTTNNGNISTMAIYTKNRIDQGKEIIHNAFANMDRGTIIRGTIVFAGIAGLVLMYVGIKAFL
jgi:hypothetical protein